MGRLAAADFERLLARHPYDCRVYIETGLWQGEQIVEAAPFFEVAHGIELDRHWATVTAERTRAFPHVQIHHGDTRQLLPALLERYADVSCFINLDAHFCRTDPPIAKSEFPLWHELEAIRRRTARDVINVDDVHTFGRARPDLRYKKDAIEWEGVTIATLTEFFGNRLTDSLVAGDGFVIWTTRRGDERHLAPPGRRATSAGDRRI
jgi:hypothetical protein